MIEHRDESGIDRVLEAKIEQLCSEVDELVSIALISVDILLATDYSSQVVVYAAIKRHIDQANSSKSLAVKVYDDFGSGHVVQANW